MENEARDRHLEEQKQTVFKKLSTCEDVKQTVGSKGWTSIVEPLIDRMIIDTVGGKVKGRWIGGALTDGTKTKSQDFYLGYKQFGIDLLSRIYGYTDSIKKLINQVSTIDKELNAPMVVPMFEHEANTTTSGSDTIVQPIYRKKEEVIEDMPCRGKKGKKSKKKVSKKRKRRKK